MTNHVKLLRGEGGSVMWGIMCTIGERLDIVRKRFEGERKLGKVTSQGT